ncbi:uncharacterized protein LOC124498197 [Dermatophagoides farinae]|uniref:uncharacterized protein LOC124498197 n=1 Tax=Dermatophagoides farinae TaxID=6954 RepID=UPI003F5F1CF8
MKSIHHYHVFCITFISIFLMLTTTAKRLRLPMLLRSNKFECTSTKDICIFSVKGFVEQPKNNITRFSDGKQNFYHFEINGKKHPRMARFYFKASLSSLNNYDHQQQQQKQLKSNGTIAACLAIDYLIQGNVKFLLIISQQSTETGQLHVLNQQQINHFDRIENKNNNNNNNNVWNTAYVNLVAKMKNARDTFIFEVLCTKNCTNRSTFSISRINLDWNQCPLSSSS